MSPIRFNQITRRFSKLRIGIVGDFCLDRYLEIDPTRTERSIETGLPVYNVVTVRSQPGGAGTILNNLVALGIGEIFPIGFAGEDGEGFELHRALSNQRGVSMHGFVSTPLRRTFTYTKPLLVSASAPPKELNRFDLKNWSRTPARLEKEIIGRMDSIAKRVDALIVMDQVDAPETGVVTQRVLKHLGNIQRKHPQLLIIADSRRSLKDFPAVIWKMNASELTRLLLCKLPKVADSKTVGVTSSILAKRHQQPVFVTLGKRGIVAASPDGEVHHCPALPVRGEIDIVGAGDAVTANLAASLATGATIDEAATMANAAASVVIHQLGTTGTATVAKIKKHLRDLRR